jgi:hypothetical protein
MFAIVLCRRVAELAETAVPPTLDRTARKQRACEVITRSDGDRTGQARNRKSG